MGKPTHPEEELVKQIKKGDESAFRLIVEKYKSAIFGLAYLILQDHQIAEEAVQETILKIWEYLPSLHTSDKLKPWLLRIAVNESKQLLRRKKIPTVPIDQVTELPDDYDLDDLLINNEDQQNIKKAISDLKTEQREVVILRYYNELTISEIAKVLSLRQGTVKSRLSRALDNIEDFVKQKCET